MFAALILKTLRMWYVSVFQPFNRRKKEVRGWHVAAAVAGTLAAHALVVMVDSVANPRVRVERSLFYFDEVSTNPDTFRYACGAANDAMRIASNFVAGAWICVLIVLTTGSALLSIKFKSAFNESRHIAFGAFLTAAVAVLFLPLIFVSSAAPGVGEMLLVTWVCVTCDAIVGALLVPKLWCVLSFYIILRTTSRCIL
jgi:hypothetical protein